MIFLIIFSMTVVLFGFTVYFASIQTKGKDDSAYHRNTPGYREFLKREKEESK